MSAPEVICQLNWPIRQLIDEPDHLSIRHYMPKFVAALEEQAAKLGGTIKESEIQFSSRSSPALLELRVDVWAPFHPDPNREHNDSLEANVF